MRLRLEDDPDFAAGQINALKHPQHWSVEALRQCAVVRVTEDDLVGFCWLHFKLDDPFTVVVHAAMPRRLLNRSKVATLVLHMACLARLMGARQVLGQYVTPAEAAAYKRLWGDPAITQDGCRLFLPLE